MTGHNTITLKSGSVYQGAAWTDTSGALPDIVQATRAVLGRNLFAPDQEGEGVLQLALADGTTLIIPATEVESIIVHVDTP